MFTRRSALGGLAAGLAAAPARAGVVGRPDLIDPFSNRLQNRVLPYDMPLLALYRRGDLALGFVAATHSVDPVSLTFARVRLAFEAVGPAVLLAEGFPTALGESPASLARMAADRGAPDADSYSRGEEVYGIALARARGIPFWGGEPTDGELYEALLASGFQATDVFFQQMLGPLKQDFRAGAFAGPADPRFEAAYGRWAPVIRRGFADPPQPTDSAAFRRWYQALFGRPVEDDPHWLDHAGPDGEGLTERIGRAANILRDRHAYDQAIRLLTQHRRAVMIFGGSHLATQWRALEAALGPPRIVRPDMPNRPPA